jgi:hypothetical protein
LVAPVDTGGVTVRARSLVRYLTENRGLVLLVLALSALLVVSVHQSGDYQRVGPSWVGDNASPAIDALVGGHFHRFAHLHPWMGSFSILLRWPFAALAELLDAGDLAVYKFGAFPCLLAVGLVGLYLAEILRARGRSSATRLAVVAVCLVNPVTFRAIELGHPEDLLAGALCVAAVLVAGRGRAGWGGVLLGLAFVTKQWAIVAVAPVLLAAPASRARVLVGAAAVALVVTLPLLTLDPQRLVTITKEASKTKGSGPTSVWTPFTIERKRAFFDGSEHRTATGHVLPSALHSVPKLLIVLTPFPLAFLLWRRRRVGLEEAMGLLALLFLLRCVLDPVSNGYYYAPFLFALAGYESLRRRGPPLLTIAVTGAVWATFDLPSTRGAVTAAWVVWAVPLTIFMFVEIYAPHVLRARWVRRRRAQVADAGTPV